MLSSPKVCQEVFNLDRSVLMKNAFVNFPLSWWRSMKGPQIPWKQVQFSLSNLDPEHTPTIINNQCISLSKDTLETLIVLSHRSHIAFLMSIMQWLWVLSKMLTYIHLYLFSSLRYDFNMPAGSYGNLVGSCFQEKKNTTAYQKKVKQWQGSFLTYMFLPSWRLWIPGVNLFVLTCNLKCQCL